MKQDKFYEHLSEYQAKMVMIANQQGYELLTLHSLYDPVTGDIFTGGCSDVKDKMVIAYMVMKQSTYANIELMK